MNKNKLIPKGQGLTLNLKKTKYTPCGSDSYFARNLDHADPTPMFNSYHK